jgi:hypothetical protein
MHGFIPCEKTSGARARRASAAAQREQRSGRKEGRAADGEAALRCGQDACVQDGRRRRVGKGDDGQRWGVRGQRVAADGRRHRADVAGVQVRGIGIALLLLSCCACQRMCAAPAICARGNRSASHSSQCGRRRASERSVWRIMAAERGCYSGAVREHAGAVRYRVGVRLRAQPDLPGLCRADSS